MRQREFEKKISDAFTKFCLSTQRIKYLDPFGFYKAGYKQAKEDMSKCSQCGDENKLHPSMLDCHGCRTKHY